MAGASTGRWVAAAAGLLVFGLAGCQSTGTTETASATPTPTGSEFDQGAVPSGSGTQTAASVLEAVYFDYDRFDIRDDAKAALASNAKAIQGNTGWGVITIEGHCDERGSEEYNRGLGERRALAVREYLVSLGVDSTRLETVSYGEDRPVVSNASAEAQHQQNRRAEFVVGIRR